MLGAVRYRTPPGPPYERDPARSVRCGAPHAGTL